MSPMVEYTDAFFDALAAALLRQGLADRVAQLILEATATDRTHGWLTIEETAAELHVHRDTLRRWELSGRLVPVRFGGAIRYRVEDVMANKPQEQGVA